MTAIRPARSDDLDSLLGLVREATLHMEIQGIHQWDDHYPDRVTLQTDIGKQHMQVIEVDGQIAGMISINDEFAPEYRNVRWRYPGRALIVHRLAIAPSHQRQRWATRLMEFAERRAQVRGYSAIRLDAFSQNPGATGLYEQLGYEKAGTVQFGKGLFFCFEKSVSKPVET
ncbi:MAG: GNAT family N-acetyltransferase [Kiritimatiellia bacterium]|nr:GNAT family N-acetyltransferase [Kiritimatiellia bacterium]